MNPFRRMFKGRSNSGKEMTMGDQTPPATPPAASGGLTEERVSQIIGDLLKPLTTIISKIADTQQSQTETITHLQSAATPVKPAEKAGDVPKYLTADDLVKVLDKRDSDRASGDAVAQAKTKIVASRLNGLSEFAALLPNTADEAELTRAADALAAKLNTTLKPANGVGIVNKAGGTAAAAQPVDKSKLDPLTRIEMGIGQSSSTTTQGAAPSQQASA